MREEWLNIAWMALAGVTTYHLALNTGETHVPAGTASLIIALSPAVAAVLSAIFLRERRVLRAWVKTITCLNSNGTVSTHSNKSSGSRRFKRSL